MTTTKTLEHNQPAPAKAGVKGGEIVAEGTPEKVAKEPRSYTGKYLAPLLERGGVTARVEVGVG